MEGPLLLRCCDVPLIHGFDTAADVLLSLPFQLPGMIPSYLEVLKELKKRGEATSVEIAKEFHDGDSEHWPTLRSAVLNKLKRARKFRPDVFMDKKSRREGRGYICVFCLK